MIWRFCKVKILIDVSYLLDFTIDITFFEEVYNAKWIGIMKDLFQIGALEVLKFRFGGPCFGHRSVATRKFFKLENENSEQRDQTTVL